MIDRKKITEIVGNYDISKIKIGVVGSHSALDACDGAVEEGFRTVAICQKGREKTYSNYFRASRDKKGNMLKGIVDEVVLLDKFKKMLDKDVQNKLIKNNVLFVPNRSFTSYVGIDAVESEFAVPLVGSRNLLRSEERGGEKDYYWILNKANLPHPEKVGDPKDINELVIVKLPHAVKKLERGFFTASSYREYKQKSESLLKQNVITKSDLAEARIEKYIIGPVFNIDMFYSPLEKRGNGLELLGIDWRFETSLDGHVRLPAAQQMTLLPHQFTPEYTVCGHNSATLRESLLEDAFELGEKYVAATQKYYKPGIIGPFCLQTCVDKDLNFYIYDVAPRIGGGTNIHMSVGHPYGNALWRKNVSTGRRLAMEIRKAVEMDKLDAVVT